MKNKKLKIDFGVPEYASCVKCGEEVDVMEYLARIPSYQNNMCLKCTIQVTKEKTKKAELVKVLDFIDRRVKNIREKLTDMTANKLKGEISIIPNQIKFLLSDD